VNVDLQRFWDGYQTYQSEHASQRPGQALFNFLHLRRRDLAEKLRGSQFDPFYNDENIYAAKKFIESNWK
jgi:hypothetical protein